jgi:bifunctional oligoribonuclease and PAP phosphatase NrnA
MISTVVKSILEAQNILLTTHRQCDGDGLGSELAMYHALRKIHKNVRILNVDATPKKYDYLNPDRFIQYYDGSYDPLDTVDLALIFDTNDKRLVEPLYEALVGKVKKIIFVDHHPILKEGPPPTPDSIINIRAASTGELAYDIIKALNIPLDEQIARALYTSIAFDTQLFRYVRNSARSHEVVTDLLNYEKNPSEVHRFLFGNFTAPKLKFIAQALSQVEFFDDEKLAILHIETKKLEDMGLNVDDSRDLVDMIMNIESVEAAALIRQDSPNHFKMSLRSKGRFPILGIAEQFGGGGHPFASGAPWQGDLQELKSQVLKAMQEELARITP